MPRVFCSPDTEVGPNRFWEGGLVGWTRVAWGGTDSHATALCPGEYVGISIVPCR